MEFDYEITALSLDDYVPWPPTPEYKSKNPILQAKRERTQAAAKKAAAKRRAETLAARSMILGSDDHVSSPLTVR